MAACKGISQSLQPDCGLNLAPGSYMFAAGRRSENVDHVIKFIGIVTTRTGVPHLPAIAVMCLRKSHRPHPHFRPVTQPYMICAHTTRQLIFCMSPPYTCHVHLWCSARHMPQKFRTTLLLPVIHGIYHLSNCSHL